MNKSTCKSEGACDKSVVKDRGEEEFVWEEDRNQAAAGLCPTKTHDPQCRVLCALRHV